MNLEEQEVTGKNQIHLTDALNSALLGLKVKRTSMGNTMPPNIIIYVDKNDRSNPTEERKEYVFPLKEQIRFLYVAQTKMIGDKFVMEFDLKDNDIVMNTYVERYVSDTDENGDRHILSTPIIEGTANIPIVLFEGENYIYTNYDQDGMDLELRYATNVESNKTIVNAAMYYGHKINCLDEDLTGDIYFKDAFTKTEDKLNLEVDNAKVECITSKNNKFSLDCEGNLTVNSINSNDMYCKDAFTKTEDKLNLEVDNAEVSSITSKNNKFSLDEEGNLTVNSITTNNSNQDSFDILSVYPVGSIYMSINNINPGTLFGGTWEQIKDRFLLACGDNYANGSIGGEAQHTLIERELPAHMHNDLYWGASMFHSPFSLDSGSNTPLISVSWTGKKLADGKMHTGISGEGKAHNNMPPYLTVYMWKRTA